MKNKSKLLHLVSYLFLISVIVYLLINQLNCCDNLANESSTLKFKEYMNNSFVIFTGTEDYETLLEDTTIDYEIENVPIQDSESIGDFNFKRLNNIDSLIVERDSSGNIRIEYYFYFSGVRPIYPVLIEHHNYYLIRGKKEQDAELSCLDGELDFSYNSTATISKMKLTINLRIEEISNKECIIFEPQESKCYIIDITPSPSSLLD